MFKEWFRRLFRKPAPPSTPGEEYQDRLTLNMLAEPKLKFLGYVKGEGRTDNPLKKYPRNLRCFCGSNRKAKGCCLPRVKGAVAEEAAAMLKYHWPAIIRGHRTVKLEDGE